jgi:hypothetical protein
MTICWPSNHGMLTVLKRCPDLFKATIPASSTEKRLADAFPLPAQYVQTLADYVTARVAGLVKRSAEERKICEGQVPVRWSKVYLRPLVAAVGVRIIPS